MVQFDSYSLPRLPWTGGCQCGGIRYTLQRAPLTLYACHCTECQRQSASAYGLSMRVVKAALDVSGRTKTWRRRTGSQHDLLGHFCPDCGVRLFHERAQYADDPEGARLNVKAGTLDDARFLDPVGHIWTGSRQAGTLIPSGKLVYEGQPDDYETLIEAFSTKYGVGGAHVA